MITLRQIEVIRAVMVAGTISGAAKLLNVSAPGVSRLVKHAERSLGVRFFQRKSGRFFPTAEAEQNLRTDQRGLQEGRRSQLHSVAHWRGRLVGTAHRLGAQPVAIHGPAGHRARAPALSRPARRHQYPQDRRGDRLPSARQGRVRGDQLPLRSSGDRFRAAGNRRALLHRSRQARARLARANRRRGDDALSADRHRSQRPVRAHHGRAVCARRIAYDIRIKARFGTTVCALVAAGLGVAVIDQFTLAYNSFPGVKLLRIAEPTRFETYVATKREAPLSLHAEYFIACLREEMQAAGPPAVGATAEGEINMKFNGSTELIIELRSRQAMVTGQRGAGDCFALSDQDIGGNAVVHTPIPAQAATRCSV